MTIIKKNYISSYYLISRLTLINFIILGFSFNKWNENKMHYILLSKCIFSLNIVQIKLNNFKNLLHIHN